MIVGLMRLSTDLWWFCFGFPAVFRSVWGWYNIGLLVIFTLGGWVAFVWFASVFGCWDRGAGNLRVWGGFGWVLDLVCVVVAWWVWVWVWFWGGVWLEAACLWGGFDVCGY